MEKTNYLQTLLDHKVVYFGNNENSFYLTGFKSSNLHVFAIKGKYLALTDKRYLEAARAAIKDMEVLDVAESKSWDHLKALAKKTKTSELYVDAEQTTLADQKWLQRLFPDLQIIGSFAFGKIRMSKTKQEVTKIKKAVALTDEIFQQILSFIKVGMSELEVQAKIRTLIVNSKANVEAFLPIVAAGVNSANPHWRGSNYKIKAGDFITLDFGQYYEGYASDMTRTIIMGDKVSAKQQEVYDLVLKAQKAALDAAKPGVKCSDLDKIARDIISEGGYGDFFVHGLGHGLGIDVHEAPSVSMRDDTILEEGMVVTIEPGIYLPDEFGIRIEDDILIVNNGSKILNKSSKDLIKIS